MKKMKMKILLKRQFHLRTQQHLQILFLSLLFLTVGFQNLSAIDLNNKESVEQQVTINGIVTASNSEPLFGVLVTVKGGNEKALTQNDGTFTIKASANAVLLFALPGYLATSQKYSGETLLSVTMTEQYAQNEVKDYFNIYSGQAENE